MKQERALLTDHISANIATISAFDSVAKRFKDKLFWIFDNALTLISITVTILALVSVSPAILGTIVISMFVPKLIVNMLDNLLDIKLTLENQDYSWQEKIGGIEQYRLNHCNTFIGSNQSCLRYCCNFARGYSGYC